MEKESMLVIVGILLVGVLLLFVFDYTGIPFGQGTGYQVSYDNRINIESCKQGATMCSGNMLQTCNWREGYLPFSSPGFRYEDNPEGPCEYGCIPPGPIEVRQDDGTFKKYDNDKAFCNNCPINSECSGNNVRVCTPTPSGAHWDTLKCPQIDRPEKCHQYFYITKCKEVPPMGFARGGAICKCTAHYEEAIPSRKGCEDVTNIILGCPQEPQYPQPTPSPEKK